MLNLSSLLISFSALEKKAKQYIFRLIIVSLISGLLEIFLISFSFLFISLLLGDKSQIMANSGFVRSLISSSSLTIESISLIYLPLISVAAFLKVYVLWMTEDVSSLISANLSGKIFASTMNIQYPVFKRTSSSDYITLLTVDVANSVGVFRSLLGVFSSASISLSTLVALLLVNLKVTLISIAGLTCLYFLLSKLVNKKLSIYGGKVVDYSLGKMTIIRESLSGIREVILYQLRDYSVARFMKYEKKLAVVKARKDFLLSIPRPLVESSILFSFVSCSLFLSRGGYSFKFLLPSLATLLFAFQRIVPYVQQIYSSWSIIQTNSKSLGRIAKVLKSSSIVHSKHTYNCDPINFSALIQLTDASFAYEDNAFVFNKLNLNISKGERLAITGASGSGKSSLIDILMGLQPLTRGKFIVDNRSIESFSDRLAWMRSISHVPQSVQLMDSSIAQNIILNSPHMSDNSKKLHDVIEMAGLTNFVDSLLDGIDTIIGDSGSILSGGQKQRLGIARALYRNTNLLVLDEPTSSLDPSTASLILKNLLSLPRSITIIVVSHAVSLLSGFDRVLHLPSLNSKVRF